MTYEDCMCSSIGVWKKQIVIKTFSFALRAINMFVGVYYYVLQADGSFLTRYVPYNQYKHELGEKILHTLIFLYF